MAKGKISARQGSAHVLPVFCPHTLFGRTVNPTIWAKPYAVRPSGPNLRSHSHITLQFNPQTLIHGATAGPQAELLFGSVPDAWVAEVPGRPLVPIQLVDEGGLLPFYVYQVFQSKSEFTQPRQIA